MPARLGYKPCIDCHCEIKKCGSRKRCDKCQAAYEIVLANRRHKTRMVACKYCQTEFVARSSSHKVCDALPCRMKQYGKGGHKPQRPIRATAERVSALPLGALQGDKFARAVNAYLRSSNG